MYIASYESSRIFLKLHGWHGEGKGGEAGKQELGKKDLLV